MPGWCIGVVDGLVGGFCWWVGFVGGWVLLGRWVWVGSIIGCVFAGHLKMNLL